MSSQLLSLSRANASVPAVVFFVEGRQVQPPKVKVSFAIEGKLVCPPLGTSSASIQQSRINMTPKPKLSNIIKIKLSGSKNPLSPAHDNITSNKPAKGVTVIDPSPQPPPSLPPAPTERLASPELENSSEEVLASMKQLVAQLYFKPECTAFRKPVDWRRLGLLNYPSIVKAPHDLGTIKKNFDFCKYKRIEEAVAEIRLVWSNCMLYNADGSAMYRTAKILSQTFENAYCDLRKNHGLKPDTTKKKRAACVPSIHSLDICESLKRRRDAGDDVGHASSHCAYSIFDNGNAFAAEIVDKLPNATMGRRYALENVHDETLDVYVAASVGIADRACGLLISRAQATAHTKPTVTLAGTMLLDFAAEELVLEVLGAGEKSA